MVPPRFRSNRIARLAHRSRHCGPIMPESAIFRFSAMGECPRAVGWLTISHASLSSLQCGQPLWFAFWP